MKFYQLFGDFELKNVPKVRFFAEFNASRLFEVFSSDLFQHTAGTSCYGLQNMRIPWNMSIFHKNPVFQKTLVNHSVLGQ